MKQARLFLFIFAGWIVFGLILTAEMFIFHPQWIVPYDMTHDLVWELSLSFVCAVSTPVILLMSRRLPIGRDNRKSRLLLHFALSVVFSLISCGIHGFFMMAVRTPVDRWSLGGIFPSLYYSIDKMMIVYWVIVFVDHALTYSRQLREKERREIALEARLAQAQLQALRMQLHPHFLFNTLNAVTTLIHRDPYGAERMIVRLGDLLRTTLDNAGKQLVPLKEEIQFLKNYLEIERIRFLDRLTVEYDLPEDTLEVLVPYLLLQPLAENALRHGLGSSVSGGRIEVIARREEGHLVLTINDNGVGLNNGGEVPAREGIGITNIRARLQQSYSSTASFSLTNCEPEGACARITIPLEAAKQ